jgi:chaperone BCS1
MKMLTEMYSNPLFAGLAGTMLMGSLLYVLRAWPMQVFWLIYRALTVRLTIQSDDSVFDWINDWLADHGYAKKARVLKLGSRRGDDEEWTMAPGFGWHFFWDNGPVLVTRSIQDKQGAGYRLRETFQITTFGRSQSNLRQLIGRANQAKLQQNSLSIRVWQRGHWESFPAKSKRSIDTIFLPAKQKNDILRDAKWFFENKQWFVDRGVPYRHGYLLYGVPGTGKSSTVTAIASYFNKPIYIVNLATVQDDNALMSAFMSTSPSCIILIEDIDCVAISNKRNDSKPAKPYREDNFALPEDRSNGNGAVTLSGLLNAIDGVASTEGRLLFMTTNHIDKLDSALIREARIDKRFELGPLTPDLVAAMARRFFPTDSALVDEVSQEAATSDLKPAAYWQTKFMDIQARQLDILALS